MLTIQQLSQEVGIAPDTLRVWERRYAYPQPQRDRRGRRQYSPEQVAELRLVKKLQNAGHRPQAIFALSLEQRRTLYAQLQGQHCARLQLAIQRLTEAAPEQLENYLNILHAKLGMEQFIFQVALLQLEAVDSGYNDGDVSIWREHVVSDLLMAIFNQHLAAQQQIAGRELHCLFVTINGERHKLALWMAACLAKDSGARCTCLNEDLPLTELPRIVQELNCAALMTSFSSQCLPRQAIADLTTLRKILPASVDIVAGGQALDKIKSLPEITLCSDLRQIQHICKVIYNKRCCDE
jgi:DNA-binding transcriptional MerR regulator